MHDIFHYAIPREPETYKIVGRKKKQGFQEKPMFAFFLVFAIFTN